MLPVKFDITFGHVIEFSHVLWTSENSAFACTTLGRLAKFTFALERPLEHFCVCSANSLLNFSAQRRNTHWPQLIINIFYHFPHNILRYQKVTYAVFSFRGEGNVIIF